MSENTMLLILLRRIAEKTKIENSQILNQNKNRRRGYDDHEYGGCGNDRETGRCTNNKQRNTIRRGSQPPPKLKDKRCKEQIKYRCRVKNRKDKISRLIEKIPWETVMRIALYGLGLMTLICNMMLNCNINIEIGNITLFNFIINFF